ncbi:hypothetical protein [Bradyrhizobium mercantei]|uniref:hypothetical protein n=1 Tax=Bradyrhizobium mercantei TaxID=1904807 RepID=UPI001AEC89DB|nr:hypothetical protein [Bradyrhizobium mercantei]
MSHSFTASFVRAEVEYILIVARSIFDLLQEVVSRFWNDHINLLDEPRNRLKKQNRLPPGFARVVFANDAPRTAQELTDRFALPPTLAEQYVRHAGFFASLRAARDHIIHGSSNPGTIFVTERGFAVDPKSTLYCEFPWTAEHHYNENIVSLMPWIANIVVKTIASCTDIVGALGHEIKLPDELAPGYRVLLRDPMNSALMRLLEAIDGKSVWWDEPADPQPAAPQAEDPPQDSAES